MLPRLFLLLLIPFLLIRADSNGKCADRAKNCPDLREQCGAHTYKRAMKSMCKMTCGHCQLRSKDCANKNDQRCREWDRKHFCESALYKESTKRFYCAKTCDLCNY
ncbi:hypothetical protein M3Y99_00638800 [Aphelenchoides fujianensis]|nr:hypothetical protein M3Y99_00638800 [Aphelenchoides fujianensis]